MERREEDAENYCVAAEALHEHDFAHSHLNRCPRLRLPPPGSLQRRDGIHKAMLSLRN